MDENPDRIEPCRLEEVDERVADAAVELTRAAEGLSSRLAPQTARGLADQVRIMNCYYSNLIEGHNTRPRDIERALAGAVDADDDRRSLLVEANAHIRVQQQIDLMHVEGRLPEPTSIDFIRWLHREFYRDATPEMLRVAHGAVSFTMEPGAFRSLPEHDVQVGRHHPPSSSRVAAFMDHFERRYRPAAPGGFRRLAALAAAHHRLNYIHPFPDGNGRVSRLMSHAMALQAGIGAHGLWSISRGLARGLGSRQDYKRMMDHADTPRAGDLDGRGNLSRRALVDFVDWFLRVCLDQVTFMAGLFDLDALGRRLPAYVEHRGLRREALGILEEALIRGEMPRGDAARATGLPERTARLVLGDLVRDGIVASDTPKGPVRLRFGVEATEILFPSLFPAS